MNDLLHILTPRITAIRRDLHAHPELAFKEQRTSDIVAAHLQALGIETVRGLAGTGVVGKLTVGSSARAIGLRADMDALPVEELNTFSHRSRTAGCMHACGHDGHTAMLLGAAEALAGRVQTSSFDGTVYFIFQPAEEHEGGARLMLEQGLFERFPMDSVYGLHNWPGLAAGQMGVKTGPVMAGDDRFAITVTGHGGHAAMPHQADDVVIAAAALVQALQTLVSRETEPFEPAVLSVTRLEAGHADNVLPEQAFLGGTVRTFSVAQQTLLAQGMERICSGIGATYGVSLDLLFEHGYPPTVNSAAETELCKTVARSVMGAENVRDDLRPSMGAEDFAFMLRERPGCYVWLGSGVAAPGAMLHGPRFDFNDDIIGPGIRYWVSLVEHALPTIAAA